MRMHAWLRKRAQTKAEAFGDQYRPEPFKLTPGQMAEFRAEGGAEACSQRSGVTESMRSASAARPLVTTSSLRLGMTCSLATSPTRASRYSTQTRSPASRRTSAAAKS